MPTPADGKQRLERNLRRDIAQQDRRGDGLGSFWRALSVVGMIGWPIALGTVGGAVLGRRIDVHYGTGVHFTLMLLTVGLGIGCYVAWKAMGGRSDRQG